MADLQDLLRNNGKNISFSPYNLIPWSISPKWRKICTNLYCFRVSHYSIALITSIPLTFMQSVVLSLNAATAQESWEWNIFKIRPLHFIHSKIHSFLPKIEELQIIAKSFNATIIGITESKLDEFALEPEIQSDNYKILRWDWNRHRKGVACYIRNHLRYDISIFQCKIESVFFEILYLIANQ